MSEVTIEVGGRAYRVACAEGEEDRVRRLADAVDEKLGSMGQLSTHDTQNMLFASLLLADEAKETREHLAAAQEATAKALRDADTANGTRDQLKGTISDLEAELARLQSSQQRSAVEMEEIQSKVTQLTQQLADKDADEAKLRAELATASEALRSTHAAAPSNGAVAVDPDLAPALERFAEQLELCADRLEGKLATS
ncbi:cell division protein ZapA [Tsuneonella mangrovi]|uniref:cell division protein ZapA n=1 Tax=Tsuneonella mangrovi TaxID=1982042 RepID=UPI000BA21258|nr:cell division protein ZapA [Tsuneonella mangrovi]